MTLNEETVRIQNDNVEKFNDFWEIFVFLLKWKTCVRGFAVKIVKIATED